MVGGAPIAAKAASTSTALETFVNASKIDRRYHRGNWCNQTGGIGARPVANPEPHIAAFVWIKPPGESDGTSNSTQNKPDAEGKQFDAMCDPTANNRYDASVKTGALPNAPDAGHWFESEFQRHWSKMLILHFRVQDHRPLHLIKHLCLLRLRLKLSISISISVNLSLRISLRYVYVYVYVYIYA